MISLLRIPGKMETSLLNFGMGSLFPMIHLFWVTWYFSLWLMRTLFMLASLLGDRNHSLLQYCQPRELFLPFHCHCVHFVAAHAYFYQDTRPCLEIHQAMDDLVQLALSLVGKSIIYVTPSSSSASFRWTGIESWICPGSCPAYTDCSALVSWRCWTALEWALIF